MAKYKDAFVPLNIQLFIEPFREDYLSAKIYRHTEYNFYTYIYIISYLLDGGSGGDSFTEEFLTVIGNNVDLICRLNGASFEWKRENGEAVPDKSFQVG